MLWISASAPLRVCEPGAACQWPKLRNPIRFTAPTLAGAGGEAGDGVRTRDLWLGKPTLYQLSYTRVVPRRHVGTVPVQHIAGAGRPAPRG